MRLQGDHVRLYVNQFSRREWFLLGDLDREADLYLDINCNVGSFGFSVLVKLSEAELDEYHDVGHAYIEYLVAKIRKDAESEKGAVYYTGVPSSRPNRYRDRDLSRSAVSAEVTDAVVKFKKTRPDVDW